MAHLVMDTLILHELHLDISDQVIVERQEEWTQVLTATSRSDYIKGLLRFCGMELLDYDTAIVRRLPDRAMYSVQLLSEQANLRKPGITPRAHQTRR